MIFYGVVNGYGNAVTGDVIEFFSTRMEAEAFISECLEDEPGWVDLLRVERIDFGQPAEFSLTFPDS